MYYPEENELKKESLALENREITINFKALFMEVLDKCLVIVLIGVLCGLSSYFFHQQVIKEDYVSTTKIYILPQNQGAEVSYADLETGTKLAPDYIEFIQSRDVVEEAVDYLGLDCTYEEFCNKLEIGNPTDTRILSISVKDKDPIQARRIAIHLRDIAISSIEELMGVDEISIVQDANLPIDPDTSSFIIAIIMAAISMIIAIIVVIIRYLVIDRIVTSDDVESRLNLVVLGAIAYEEKKKQQRRNSVKKNKEKRG